MIEFFSNLFAPIIHILQVILGAFYSVTSAAGLESYGFPIILLTILIKLVTYPLTVKPILMGMYYALFNFTFPSAEAAAFFWLPSMSEPDPYYILPVLSAATTFLQQKMTSSEMTGQMKIMMTVMPLFIGWISLTFPSGLVLYWVTMNVVQIAQQWWMYRGEDKTAKGAA